MNKQLSVPHKKLCQTACVCLPWGLYYFSKDLSMCICICFVCMRVPVPMALPGAGVTGGQTLPDLDAGS